MEGLGTTIQSCVKFCSDNGYYYAGLQNGYITHFKLFNKQKAFILFFKKVMVYADAVMGMVHLDWLVLIACHVMFHVLI